MELSFATSGSVTINGESYSGRDITIKNGVVTIDGVRQDGAHKEQTLNITVKGDVGTLSTTSGDVVVNGYVVGLKTVSGDVDCCDVKADVQTVSGDVNAAVIHGSVKTISGDIRGVK